MESTPKTPWSRKRKLKGKMELLREAKLAKSDHRLRLRSATLSPNPRLLEHQASPLRLLLDPCKVLLESMRQKHQQSRSMSPSVFLSPCSLVKMIPVKATRTVRASAMMMHDRYTKEQPKHVVKIMAVMFMDALIDRFNMTSLGAANEVGLVLSHNEKMIRTWRQDFYANHSHFTESR